MRQEPRVAADRRGRAPGGEERVEEGEERVAPLLPQVEHPRPGGEREAERAAAEQQAERTRERRPPAHSAAARAPPRPTAKGALVSFRPTAAPASDPASTSVAAGGGRGGERTAARSASSRAASSGTAVSRSLWVVPIWLRKPAPVAAPSAERSGEQLGRSGAGFPQHEAREQQHQKGRGAGRQAHQRGDQERVLVQAPQQPEEGKVGGRVEEALRAGRRDVAAPVGQQRQRVVEVVVQQVPVAVDAERDRGGGAGREEQREQRGGSRGGARCAGRLFVASHGRAAVQQARRRAKGGPRLEHEASFDWPMRFDVRITTGSDGNGADGQGGCILV